MARGPVSRPLREIFIARVIAIKPVQQERVAVTEKHVGDFFEFGRVPGQIGKYLWPLDGAPEPFPRGIIIDGIEKDPVSPAMARAWDAAVRAKDAFVADLRAGVLIATATYATTGERRDLEPAEWMRTDLVLDVRDGMLFAKGRDVELWSAITLRDATEQPVEPTVELLPVKPTNKLGRVDWDDWWLHEIARRKTSRLPPKKAYLNEAEALIKQRYLVAHVELSELRRICAALYRGDSERPRRKRQSHKRPQSRSKSP